MDLRATPRSSFSEWGSFYEMLCTLGLVSSPRSKLSREPSRRLLLSAARETPTDRYAVVVRDLTEDEAIIQGDRLPRTGALVCLRRGMTEAYGEVLWVDGDEAKLEFDEVVERDSFEAGATSRFTSDPQPYRRPGLNRGSDSDVSDAAGSLAAGGGAPFNRRDLSDLKSD